jgi:hypothetical protein
MFRWGNLPRTMARAGRDRTSTDRPPRTAGAPADLATRNPVTGPGPLTGPNGRHGSPRPMHTRAPATSLPIRRRSQDHDHENPRHHRRQPHRRSRARNVGERTPVLPLRSRRQRPKAQPVDRHVEDAGTVFHRVVVFDRQAQHVAASLKKGDTVLVAGGMKFGYLLRQRDRAKPRNPRRRRHRRFRKTLLRARVSPARHPRPASGRVGARRRASRDEICSGAAPSVPHLR